MAHKEPHVDHSPDPRVALCEPCVALCEPGGASGTDVFYSVRLSCGIVLLQASKTHIEYPPQTAVFDLETSPITRTPKTPP